MDVLEIQQPGAVALEDLRRLQRTLERHASERDPQNILAVGFGPKVRGGQATTTLSARYVVRKKLPANRLTSERIIPRVARVRLMDEESRTYRVVPIPTDVVARAEPIPMGVTVRFGSAQATTAAVVRWTTETPVPKDPDAAFGADPGVPSPWRWGLMTVAHAVRPGTPRSDSSRSGSSAPRIDRVVACDVPLRFITGTVAAVGRIPGGPDVAVVETGLDRLWLSGFVPRPDLSLLPSQSELDVMRWIRDGGSGYMHGNGRVGRWSFEAYFPERTLPGLGRLEQVMQYTIEPSPGDVSSLGPGSSGSILVDGGVPAAMHLAALRPEFRTGCAQLTRATLPWLKQALNATELGIVRVV